MGRQPKRQQNDTKYALTDPLGDVPQRMCWIIEVEWGEPSIPAICLGHPLGVEPLCLSTGQIPLTDEKTEAGNRMVC